MEVNTYLKIGVILILDDISSSKFLSKKLSVNVNAFYVLKFISVKNK